MNNLKAWQAPSTDYGKYCGYTWLCRWLWNIIFPRLRTCSHTTEFTERRLLSHVPRQSEMLFLLYQTLLPCLFLHLLSWASGKVKQQVYLRELSKEQRNHQSCFTQSSVLVCNAKLFRGTEKEASSGHQNFTSALQELNSAKEIGYVNDHPGERSHGKSLSYSKHTLEPPDRTISPLIYSMERKDSEISVRCGVQDLTSLSH